MSFDSVPTLPTYHPHLSREIIVRYNNLVQFLNSLPLADKWKLDELNYFKLVLDVYENANNTTSSLTHSLTLMMLKEVETMYDTWATMEETIRKVQNSPIPVKKRISSSAKSPQSFFKSKSTEEFVQPVYSQNFNNNTCSNVYATLAVGAGVLGVIGVAVALEPLAWMVGLVTLAASPTVFCLALTIYACAVATCFIAAVVFGVLSSKADKQNAMEASSLSFAP